MSTKRPSPSTPEQPPKRCRGRPPGSKSRASSTAAAASTSPTSKSPTTPRNPSGISLEEATYIFDSLHDGANWTSIIKHTNEHLAPAGVSRQPNNVKLHWAKTVRKVVLALYKPRPEPQPQPVQRNLLAGVEVVKADEEGY